MVIFVKPNGETVVENALLSVGSRGGGISIVAPSRAGAHVEMTVQTPTGEILPPIYAAPVLSIDAEDIGLYTCIVVPGLTAAVGRVGYQISFEYDDGEIEVLPGGSFVVQPGYIRIPPDEPSKSMYEEIKEAMISASTNYVDVYLRLEKALESANMVEASMERIEAATTEVIAKAAEVKQDAANADADAATARAEANRAKSEADRAKEVLDSLGAVGDVAGTVNNAVSSHNTSTAAHSDIRALVSEISQRLTTFLNSDDTTLDQTKEIVAYIKSNRGLIEQITTGKVSVSDIVDNLTTNDGTKPLSAAQGVKLKQSIDALMSAGDGGGVKYIEQTLTDSQKAQARANIGAAPAMTWGTEDIEAGSPSTEPTGTLHLVIE